MFGYLPSPSPVYECFVPRNSSDSWSCQLARQIQWSMDLLIIGGDIVKMSPNNPKVISGSSSRCDTGFMKKNTKFIVSNDLNISPMNSFSTIGLLKKMQVNISDLEEQQISISRAELISILRASLVSSSALTNGLSNFLVKKPRKKLECHKKHKLKNMDGVISVS
ncbi:hypothetical protein F2Q68_00026946 [Brassica cretica]|nr:hypothetical protein F2Q68_00026946 [Brassica cretica]